MRASAVVACLLALSACGRSGPRTGPSDLAGGGGPDGAAPVPDAAPDLATARDARAEIPAADVGHRDAIPTLEDATLAGPCGVPGAKCPVYVGSTVWKMLSSSYWVAGAMGPDGSIYIGGTVESTFDFDPTAGVDVEGTDGQPSGFLMKLGPTGAYRSTFTIAGDSFGPPQIGAPAVTATASFVPGSFDGPVDLDPGPGVDMVESMVGRGGTFISKFDAAGGFVWGRVLASSESGIVYWGQPVAAPDGGVILTGSYTGPGDLAPGPPALPTPNMTGAFVTRLDASGNQLWVRTLGGDGCQGVSMQAALDGGGVLWLSGTVAAGCAFDQGGPAGPDPEGFFVASMTLDGKIRTFGTVTASASLAGPPLVASDSSIYIAGNIGPSGPDAKGPIDVDPSAGVSNLTVPDAGVEFVMKLDHDGKLRWLRPIDLELTVFGAVALAPADGLVLVSSWTSGPAGMTILGLDASGNEVWRLLAGGRDTLPWSVLVNATGFFVLGEQNGSSDLDPSPGVDTQSGPMVFLSRYTF
ncbi:MAG TPA: hypothetical protein VHL80_12410 [Polyangia bacterium]|nr:hypothetical protein [Polyangia bacterium]